MVLKTSDIIGLYGKARRKFNKIEIFIRASAPAIACWFRLHAKTNFPSVSQLQSDGKRHAFQPWHRVIRDCVAIWILGWSSSYAHTCRNICYWRPDLFWLGKAV
jgi:hypothetical protein